MGRPAVSVVVPTYQRRELVRRAAASVLAQTFPHLELIVVDDGSTDGTEDALRGLDPRLRYHRQAHRGVAAARNVGIRLARGDVVAFLDSDDRWLPDHVDVVVEMLRRAPAAVLACTCPGYRVAGRARPDRARLVDLLPRLVLHNPLGYPSGVAVRRGDLVAAGGFDERLRVWEDADLWLRLAIRGRFVFLARRTIVRGRGSESLYELGRRGGGYLEAFELAAPRTVEELERSPAGRARRLVPAARSVVALVAGLRALLESDPQRVRAALADACLLWPRLSRDPDAVVARIVHVAPGRELEPALRAVAELWPEPQADTALFLRSYAALLALAEGRPSALLDATVWRGIAHDPGFLVRTAPVAARRVRRRLRALRELRAGGEPLHGLRRVAVAGPSSIVSLRNENE